MPGRLIPVLYPRGTYCAAAGLAIVALYYDIVWRHLKHRATASPLPPASINPSPHPFPERRSLYWGMGLSVCIFLLAGAADAPRELAHLFISALMGLCGAFFGGMLGFGLVSLWNLWKEALLQAKYAAQLLRLVKSKGVNTPSLFRPIVLAILWLALGIGVFIVLGVLIDFLPKSWLQELPDLRSLRNLQDLQKALGAAARSHVIRSLLMVPIAAFFYALWKSHSYAGLIARFILLFIFSAIILAFTVFVVAWAASETAPVMVTFLAAIATLNTLFYARWVRLKALTFNLE